MNIPIKFRAWDLHDVEPWGMIYPGKSEPHGVVSILFSDCPMLYVSGKSPYEYEHDKPRIIARKIVVMQFTGLKDKNGVEIFEGDVVGDKGVGPRYEIKFVDGSFVMSHINGRTEFVLYGRENIIEVLGNVHQHPHLLEKLK